MASSSTPSSIHIHPHSTHISDPPIPDGAGEIEDHDYESLPVGAGWGVNMMAGAMVGPSKDCSRLTSPNCGIDVEGGADDVGGYFRARCHLPSRFHQSKLMPIPTLGLRTQADPADTDASPTITEPYTITQPLFHRRIRIWLSSAPSSSTRFDDFLPASTIRIYHRGSQVSMAWCRQCDPGSWAGACGTFRNVRIYSRNQWWS